MTEAHENSTLENQKSTSENWCKHDIDSRLVPAMQLFIIKTGAAGYGFFWAVVEEMHRTNKAQQNYTTLNTLANVLGLSQEQQVSILEIAITSGLWHRNQEGIFSPRANEEIEERMGRVKRIKELRSKAGKKSAEQRSTQVNTSQQTSTNVNQRREEKSRVDEIREDLNTSILTREVVCEIAPPPLVLEKPKKTEKPVVPPFAHVRMTPEEVARFKAEYPDKAMREFYYQSVDDYLDNNPKKRGRDCNRTLRAFIRSDKAAGKGWFTPKRGPYVNERPGRQPFSPNGTEKELLSIYARQGKPNGIP